MIEEWKYLCNEYSVSNLGNVRSNERTVIRSNGRKHLM